MKNKRKYRFLDTGLPLKKRVADLVSRLTLDEKVNMLSVRQKAVPRLGIGEWNIGTEVARGYVGRQPGEYSTVFPQPVGLAATFDPALMRELGEIAGTEARVYHKKEPCSKLMMFGPTVDLLRDPRWGRNEEGYGEDPFLAGEMSAAYAKGMRGGDKRYMRVFPILKHFCCNNREELRGTDNANVEPRTLYEYYYAAFEPAIKSGGALSLMTAYNELSGVPCMINPEIKKICIDKWGMLFAVTDGGDFTQNVLFHKYGSSHAETISLALKAGNYAMCDSAETTAAAALEAVKRGLMGEKDVDRAVTATLTGRFMLGEFDPPEKNPYADIPDEKLNCAEFKAVGSLAARECVTLLKNDGLLPIKANGGERLKIAVVGPLADANYPDWYTGKSDYHITVLQGLRDAFGKDRVSYHDGCDTVALKSLSNGKYIQTGEDGFVTAGADKVTAACRFKKIEWGEEAVYVSLFNGKLLKLDGGFINADGNDTYEWFGKTIFRPGEYFGFVVIKTWRGRDIAVDANGRLYETFGNAVTKEKLFGEEILSDGVKEAAKIAEKADYAIICAGNNPMVTARECYDRKTLALPPAQQRLACSVSAANPKSVLVITSSYPYAINKEQRELPAIVHTAHGGPESGSALADVLTGKYNPAGRLPQTWYKSERELPDITDYDIIDGGSTYLYFEGEALYPFGHGLSYSSFEYSDFSVEDGGKTVEARLKVKNVSGVYGEEVVQLYFTALEPRVKRPKKQLCGFIRKGIKPGETAEIAFVFNKNRLRFWDVTRGKFAVETGRHRFYAASSSADIRRSFDVDIIGEKIPPRDLTETARAVDYDGKFNVRMRYDRERKRHYINGSEFGGELEFFGVSLDGVTGIEVRAATDAGEGEIGVFVGGERAGEIKIPATASPTGFKKRKARFEKPLGGAGNLVLKLPFGVNLLDVRLFAD
ncbi:MAG: glycoside hydrolase family 3 C-terminal domain-containing protein [Oscillospiraceae bacterium]|jgi:beta-glucosidase|nr:glycoside hydrolase family 3 C-terminal domain-containing protein [Oscillospiraceae bacterium]